MAMLSARGLMDRGKSADAARVLMRAVETARAAHNTWQQARVLLVLSGCRIMLFDYRDAMQTAESARRLALRANDNTTAGSAAINLATLYLQLGDVRLAAREASYAADLLKNSDRKRRLAQALLIYANVNAERVRIRLESPLASGVRLGADQAKKQIESDYHRGIEVTHAAGLTRLEANFWEELGYSLLLAHLPAEEPLKKAYALETASHDQDALAVNRSHQAEWEFRQGNYPLALRLIDQAFASKSSQFRRTPQFYLLHLRGLLLQKLNRESEALAELRRAADAASAWREGALPGDATSTRTVVVLNEVYQDYAQLAAQVALRTGNNGLAREALEVLAENRAANLREEITVSYSRKQRLPQRYFDLLSDLQSTQARLVLGVSDSKDNVKLEQVRLELGNLENELGANQHSALPKIERISHRNSLTDIQARLSSREVLLSFDLGKQNSFLWTVTADRVSVYKLAGESEIAHAAREFSQAVQTHRGSSDEGLRLSRLLFSNLQADLSRKPDWLIVADGVLLEGVPFSALPDLSKPKSVHFLAESHDIRFLPSELLLLSVDKVRAQSRFLGVGDPIYNMADSRRLRTVGLAEANRASNALARLVGSDREVRNASGQSGMAQTEILDGRQATVTNLQQAIARRPEIVHFAVHVVSPAARSEAGRHGQAAIALSLTTGNIPELLTPEAIATLRLPGSLVVISGCSSQRGEILPGAGLMGLGRAWLLAGASAVVVSAWPTPDDSGRFFSSFYCRFNALSSGSLAQRAALALQQAQVEMEHGIGYRSAPRFWAAYSIFAKE